MIAAHHIAFCRQLDGAQLTVSVDSGRRAGGDVASAAFANFGDSLAERLRPGCELCENKIPLGLATRLRASLGSEPSVTLQETSLFYMVPVADISGPDAKTGLTCW